MLFNTLCFVSLPVGQVKPKNNLPEAISACSGQALISNPGTIGNPAFRNFVTSQKALILHLAKIVADEETQLSTGSSE